ncbi:alkaline phosphatase D family protein [Paraurantiacibacter namhicola]|uniref:PhoD-like phosphatase n=1 Tax=Paraurantiacibacter namhicola TaxID=645517 RepID=A0A1C7DAS8_9SPHN|nr:alkaline phosphatase D family protein [Paraurantiacibacter namhicola]ANU08403.1 PhoD-like phosphatase [Paraurantiacibacter namhicola]
MSIRIAKVITMAAALSMGAAACVSVTDNSTTVQQAAGLPTTSEAALRPYYQYLRAELDLPQAGPSRALPMEQAITRFGFGSCNTQDGPQDIWSVVGAANPQFFMPIGDNVYGDRGWDGRPDLASFIAAYRKQAGHQQFAAFRATTPMMATWDDHDYGPNDSGGEFYAREFSETLFETFWNAPAEVRGRPGVYQSVTMGPAGQRVQVIMLDTRFFRTNLVRLPRSEERRPLGNYAPNTDPAANMLGDVQWAWLADELAEPADLRIVVSSIQVLTEAHQFESWANMPLQRARLLQMLGARAGGGLLMLSGDRHSAGMYSAVLPGSDETAWEFTSSSMNLPFAEGDIGEREPDPLRRTPMIADANFGLVDIDWAGRTYTMRLMGEDGAEILSQPVSF